jgi:hypothetical protein
MTASDNERRLATDPGGEQAAEDTTSEETRSARPDLIPSSPGGKASTASKEDIQRCAPDTINEGDGNYLEPPD